MGNALRVNEPIDPADLLKNFNEKIVRLESYELLQSSDNAKLLVDLIQNVTDCIAWAPAYDYGKLQANGYWSVVLYIERVIDYGLMSEHNVEPLIPVIALCNRWFKLVRANRDVQRETEGKNRAVFRLSYQ